MSNAGTDEAKFWDSEAALVPSDAGLAMTLVNVTNEIAVEVCSLVLLEPRLLNDLSSDWRVVLDSPAGLVCKYSKGHLFSYKDLDASPLHSPSASSE